ncbi:hypothetical protein F4778DRAFT_730825 [Xylariomycetidae sp. FL2044]|nr:hypothetical protein F4778DRAFT_730825 [Xylariomycetidae sp. FL2044]
MADADPNIPYTGKSAQGCSFVEGHRCLSPATAARFMERGTLQAAGLPRSWCGDRKDIQRWLSTAEFNPRGRARPISILGQQPIIRYAEDVRNEEMIMVGRELDLWFEREWNDEVPRSLGGLVFRLVIIVPGVVVFIAFLLRTYAAGL